MKIDKRIWQRDSQAIVKSIREKGNAVLVPRQITYCLLGTPQPEQSCYFYIALHTAKNLGDTIT